MASLPGGVPAAFSVQPPAADGNEAAGPFLVHFPSGFQPGKDADVEWQVFQHRNRRQHYLLVARTKWADFVGYTHGRDRNAAPACVFAVGQLDAASGQMTYRAAEGQHVVRMEPRVPGMEYGPYKEPAAAAAVSPDADEKLRRREANKRLVDQFGSTRRKRQMTNKELGAVNPDSIENPEQITGLLEEAHQRAVAGGTTKEEVLAAAAAARNIPPHHPESTRGADAYKLRELIPQSAWHALEAGALQDVARAVASGDDAGAAAVPAYVRSRLPLLTAAGLDKRVFKHRAKALGWLSALLAMHGGGGSVKARTGGVSGLARAKKLPVDAVEAILELFYSKTVAEEGGSGGGGGDAWSRPEAMKTLMLHYVFVTALLLEDCQLGPAQFDALRRELKLRPADMAARFRELGATATPIKSLSAGSSPGGQPRQYHIALLPADGAALQQRTLGDAFPKIKSAPKGRGGR